MITNDDKKALQCIYNTVGTINQWNEMPGKTLNSVAIQKQLEQRRGVLP